MQILLHEQNTKIIPVYVRSAQHLHADLISRNKVMPDWHLSRPVAQKLFLSLGYPQVDLMATSNSNQVDLYFSALIDKGALGIDAFTEDWDKFTLAYIFPPPPMVELVLNRIYQCSNNSSFILITPWRVRALWFPKVLKLATQTPIRLPVSWNTVAESEVSPTNSKGGKIKFVAWKISGMGGQKLENCPLGLLRLFSRAG